MKNDYLNEPDEFDIPEITDTTGAIPYKKFKEAKKQITIRIKPSTVFYFTKLSEETGIPYQTLINMYLDDCAANQKKLNIEWT